MLESTVIKMGIYKTGANVRVVAEMDLISQETKLRDEAIYLTSVSVLKDPREEFDDEYINQWKKNIVRNFKEHKFDFKAKNREDADKFIAFNTDKWEVVREFSEI